MTESRSDREIFATRETLQKFAKQHFMEQYLQGAGPGEWRTANKINILIKEMGNGHLRNAIQLVQRKELTDHPKYGELLQEASRRGWVFQAVEGDFFLDGAL